MRCLPDIALYQFGRPFCIVPWCIRRISFYRLFTFVQYFRLYRGELLRILDWVPDVATVVLFVMLSRNTTIEPKWTRHLTVKFAMYISISLCKFQIQTVMSQGLPAVGTPIGTVNGYIGNTSTLVCDLRNIPNRFAILWYHYGRSIYISSNEIVYQYVPESVKNRVAVVCDRGDVQDTCTLTIADTNSEDAGTYFCGYVDGLSTFILSVGDLSVTVWDPPSNDSPICEIFMPQNGKLIPIASYGFGEEIILRCLVKDASVSPELFWLREDTQLGETVRGFSLQRTITLRDEDEGAVYTCVMSHPAVSEPRNCSITLRPTPSSTTASAAAITSPIATTIPTSSRAGMSSTVTPTSTTHERFNVTTSGKTTTNIDPPTHASSDEMTSNTSSSSMKPSYALPAVAVVCGIVLVIIAIVFALLWRKRYKTSPIPSKLDYELTFNRDRSITAEYAVVHAPDSIDKANAVPGALSPVKKPTKLNSNPTNLSRQSKAVSTGDTSEDEGLTYADLDLDTNAGQAMRISIRYDNEDATVYADIQGTL